jgi:phenylpropionate dioxygenase-like ring-hydroxylating dioxygenase large terminal subunit
MYINFWYPVVRSQDLGTTPQRVRILAHDFVAFRDEKGKAAVLSDTCVHRGGSLAGGKCKEDGTVQCPYHGWRFNSRGECTRIPSLGMQAKIPPRARVDAYPVEERYGIVFAFLGDLPEAERPPIMPVDEHDTPEWRSTVVTFDVEYHYERSIENGLDPMHNEFVHPTQGAPMMSPERQRQPLPMEDIPWGSKFYVPFGDKRDHDTQLQGDKTGERVGAAGSWHQGPNQLVTWIDLTATNSFHQYMFEAPIDESRTRVYLVSLRNWLLDDRHEPRMDAITLQVVQEDVNLVESLNPVRTPDSTARELLVPGDTAIARYREWLRKWEANGWRIDLKALRSRQGDEALVIPSPGRRESSGWVLQTVPLRQA